MEFKSESERNNVQCQKTKKNSVQEFGALVANALSKDYQTPTQTQLQSELDKSIFSPTPDYTQAILKLMELRDKENNIIWRIDSSQKNNSPKDIIMRDARDVKCVKTEDKYAYQIQAINHIRGALLLLDEDQSIKKERVLDYLLQHFIKNMNNKKCLDEKTIQAEFKHFNTVLINTISSRLNISIKDAQAQLAVAREFANLEIKAIDVATITKLKGKSGEDITHIQAEIALTELSPNLIQKYKNRGNEEWYKKLALWEQKLVDKFSDRIITGNYILPTQLRKILLGLRNAHHNFSGVLDRENHFILLDDNFHSGTIAYRSKDDKVNQEIANLHAQQLKQNHNVNHLITLNSPTNPKGDDKKIVSNSVKAMGFIHGSYTNLPLNWWRTFTPNIYDGIFNQLKEVRNNVLSSLFSKMVQNNITVDTKVLEDIRNYLNPKFSNFSPSETIVLDKIYSTLSTLQSCFTNDNEAQIQFDALTVALKLSYLTRHNANLKDSKNQNLFIAALANILDFQLSVLSSDHERTSSACQSGKDRNGILIFTTNLLAFLKFINDKYSISSTENNIELNNQNNIIRLAAGGHFQFMAGFLGGTLGAFGIKSDSLSAIPKGLFPQEVIAILILKTAQLNKKVLIDDKLSQNQQVYYSSETDDLNALLQVIMNALLIQLCDQDSKLNPKERSKFLFNNIFHSRETTTFQAVQLNELLNELSQLPKCWNLQDLLQKIDETLNFLTKNAETNKLHKPGTTIALLSDIQAQLKHIQTLQKQAPSM